MARAKMEDGYSGGTVRKHGGKWQAIVQKRVGGERKQLTKTLDVPCNPNSNAGKATAEKLMRGWIDELKAKDAEPPAPRMSEAGCAEYCKAYVELLAKTGAIEPSTALDYSKNLKHLGSLAALPLAGVGRTDIEQWELELLDKGLSPVTAGKCHRILKQCLTHAYEAGDIARNPMLGVRPPKRAKKPPNALDADSRARLIRILGETGPTALRTGIALALYAGLRQGEACALRWRNVDLAAGTLRVEESIGIGTGGAYLKEPKTGGSRRTIPMVPQLLEIIRQRRAAMLEACAEAGVLLRGDSFVIGRVDGAFQGPTDLGRQWRALASSYGLTGVTGARVTFHDLRHTFATVAIAEGVDVKTVSSMLGHANAAMTLNVYAASDPDAKRAAATKIGAAFERPSNVIEFRPTGTTG